MSKFDLRDISERLTRSANTEAVVSEFLGYLQAIHSDWRAALAFYEVSRDSLVKVYERRGSSLVGRDVTIPVDHLPTRLVRKFFHPSSFFNQGQNRSMLSQLFQGSPYYEPDPVEAPALRSLVPISEWQSCTCLPLADHEDMLALLVIASEKKNAFGSKTVGEVIPIKSMAALALSQHLYRTVKGRGPAADAGAVPAPAADFSERIHRLNAPGGALEQDNQTKARKLEALTGEVELLDKSSSQYKQELERVKRKLTALEQESVAATEQLTGVSSQLNQSEARGVEMQRTIGFMKDVSQVLSQAHDPAEFTTMMVMWFCQHFAVDRCSLMLLDPAGETLLIAAQRGIDPQLATQIRVRIGQGVAGWVAHNRKPLFVRVKQDAEGADRSGRDDYNSDSFICAPLVYNNRVWGVLNLSNRREGQAFTELDLDRAQLVASVVAVVLGSQESSRRGLTYTPPPGSAVSVR